MRKVLITGATSGFGKLMVDAFLENGDYVIATGRKITERNELFILNRAKYPARFLEVDLDVTQKEEISRAQALVQEKAGDLDILINNAGFGQFGALEDLTEEEVRIQMEVNFFGTVAVIQAFLPGLRTSKGKIFNFSSVYGFMGFPLTSVYCASKYAVEGLTESLRGELAPHGIQVCLIEPGGYRTNFGNNISWGQDKAESVYDVQKWNYQKLHALVSKKKPQEPKEVSDGVLKLSKLRRLPMRKVFGMDGRLSFALKTYLPSKMYFLIMDIFFKKAFLRKT